MAGQLEPVCAVLATLGVRADADARFGERRFGLVADGGPQDVAPVVVGVQVGHEVAAPKIEVADRTGAGDSFASGFVSEYMRSEDIIASIQLGIANANGCLSKLGAKNGLLEKGQNFEKVNVQITKI